MQPDSPSQLVMATAGPQFVPFAGGSTLLVSCACAMCGRRVAPGEKVHSVGDLPDSFTNEADLIDGQEWMCDPCKGMGRQIFIQKYATALVTLDGFYPIRKSEELLHFMQKPPSVPYVVTVSTLKVQHVVWRSVLNLDPALMRVFIDGRLITVRRHLVLKGLEANAALQIRIEDAARVANPKKKVTKSKDRLWIPNYEIFGEGQVHKSALPEERKLILTMNTGELWALSRCATAKNQHPPMPSPI